MTLQDDLKRQLESAQNRIAQLEDLLARKTISETFSSLQSSSYEIFDRLIEGCQVIGFDWRYLYMNETAAAHGRQTKDALLGRTIMACYPGIEDTDMFAALRRCMEQRRAESIENEFVYEDQTTHWFELRIQPIPEGLIIFSLDVTAHKRVQHSLQRYARRMETLHHIDMGILNATSVPEVIKNGLKDIRQLIGCQRATVVLFDWAHGSWTIFADDADRPYLIGHETHAPVPPQWDDGFGTETARILNDLRLIHNPTSVMTRLIQEGLLSGIQCLMKDQGETIGLLGLNASQPNFFTPEHLEIAVEVAAQLTIAMRQIRLMEAATEQRLNLENTVVELTQAEASLKRSAQRMDILHKIDQGIIEARSIDDLMASMLMHIRDLIPCDQAGVMIFDHNQYEGVFAAHIHTSAVQIGARIPILDETWFSSFNPDDTKQIDNLAELTELSTPAQMAFDEGYRSILQVLLLSDGQRIGLLNLLSRHPYFFTAEHRHIAVQIGTQLSIAIQQMQLKEELEQKVHHLTQAEAILRTYARRMDILHEIDQGIMEARSIPQVLASVLKRTREMLLCPRAVVVLFDWEQRVGTIFADSADAPYIFDREYQMPIPADWREGFGSSRVHIIDDMRLLEKPSEIFKQLVQQDLVSEIKVLLLDQGQVIGLLALTATIPSYFNPEHAQILSEIASQVTIAIRQFRLSNEVSQHTQELEQSLVDLRQAQETLRLSEARYRTVVEDQTELICRYDPNFRLTFVNRLYAQHEGMSPEDLIGKTFLHKIPSPDREKAIAHVLALTPENPVAAHEHQTQMPDGTLRWYQWTDRALMDDTGQIVEYQAVGRDITEQKLAQSELQALYEATSQLFTGETLLDLAHHVVKTVVRVFDQADCGLMLISPKDSRIYRLARTGAYEIHPQLALEVTGPGLVPLAIRTGEIVYAPDVSQNPDYLTSVSNTQSELVIPLKTNRGVIGVLDLQHMSPQAFNARDQRILAAYAERAAAAIENRQLYETLNEYTANLEDYVAERTVALNRTKERVEAILNNSLDAILLIHSDLTIQQANPAFYEMFGSADHYSDKQLMDLILQDDVVQVMAMIQAQSTDSHHTRLEVRARRYDETVFEIDLSIGAIQGRETQGFVCTFRDITERKSQERQLRFYASLQANVSDAVIAVDNEMRIQSWNQATESIYGWRADEVVGKNVSEVLDTEFQWGDSREKSTKELLKNGQWRGEVTQRHKHGHRLHILSSVTQFRDDRGLMLGSVAVNHDITERKRMENALRESEEKFRLFMEAAPIATVITNQEGQIVLVNIQTEVLSGYSRTELIGQPVEILLPETLREAHMQHRTGYIETPHIRQMGHDIELFVQRKDQSSVPVEIELSYIDTNDGLLVMSFVVDITERKERERQLRYHASLQENVSDAVIVTDMEFRIQSWNRAAERTYGWPPEDVIGKKTSAVLKTDFMTEGDYASNIAKLKDQGWWQDEVIQYHRDGSVLHMLASVTLVKDERGIPFGVVSVNHNITERRQAQLELDEERNRLRSLIDTVPDFISIKDLEHRYVLVNQALTHAHGLTNTDEIIGTTDFDHYPPDIAERFLEIESELLRTGKPVLNREENLNNYRGYSWIAFTKLPLRNLNGDTIGLVCVGRDIGEQKRAEAALKDSESKYRSLVETMRGGLIMYDDNDIITYVNDRFCEQLGYSRAELIGVRIYDTLKVGDLKTLRAHLDSRRTMQSSSYEIPVIHKSGKLLFLLVSGSPLLDRDGRYNGGFAVITDISSQKQAEETLRQSLAKEKDLNELKSRFVSMASHEFRTPLATILALTETLSAYRKRLSEEQIEDRFDKIKEQISYLKAIMEDVLLLARMQARRVDFNAAPVDLDALCLSVLDEYRANDDDALRFEYVCHPNLRNVVLDKKLIRQVISNLLSNAVKYSPPGKPIQMTLDHKDGSLVFTLRDQGIGIPEPDLGHLFEPFHRAANVGTIPGTGLGLVITKELVELHGGTISVESILNVATTFVIRIPAAVVAEEGSSQ